VFANEQGIPSLYESNLGDASNCGYDASGNLFVDGIVSSSPAVSELTKGSSTFVPLTVNGNLGFPPSQVQWDGKYITYQSAHQGQARIYRLAVSGNSATIVRVTKLANITSRSFQSWIYNNTVVVPFDAAGSKAANRVGIWQYPKGRKPERKYSDFPGSPDFQAVTVSR
jgi:hypothetical protein